MIILDHRAIRSIFSCNGFYDGRSFYLIDSFKYCNEVAGLGLTFLQNKYRRFADQINDTIIKFRKVGKNHTVASFFNDKNLGEAWNIKLITDYIDSDIKVLFKTILLTSERDFLTFDIEDNENGFTIDFESIH